MYLLLLFLIIIVITITWNLIFYKTIPKSCLRKIKLSEDMSLDNYKKSITLEVDKPVSTTKQTVKFGPIKQVREFDKESGTTVAEYTAKI